ncbi:MAG: DUF58 domain-containing protein [Bryobacteraceae bacterium]|nr:DUF58 domain-containing protein [Bryobacteraceae bacterium]
MLSLWRKMRAALMGGMRQQVTAGGLLYTLAITMVGLAAFASANNLLFLLLAAMLSTMLISNFVSRLGLAGLELDIQLPEHLSARRPVTGRISVINDKRWIPSFSIHLTGLQENGLRGHLYFPVIPGRSSVSENVELVFPRRGYHRDNAFRFSTRFPFGFTDRRIDIYPRGDILVYPCIDPQPGFEELLATVSGEIETHLRGRGSDFYRLRPYQPSENARHVDWKATAHSGELQVREFAREQDPLVEIYLDLDVPPERYEWFEKAVDCCAFLVWHVSRRGARILLRTQTAALRIPEQGDVYTILKYLAVVEPLRGRQAASPDNELSVKILFTASESSATAASWDGSHIVGPDTLDAGASARSGDKASAAGDLRNGRRKDQGGSAGFGHPD